MTVLKDSFLVFFASWHLSPLLNQVLLLVPLVFSLEYVHWKPSLDAIMFEAFSPQDLLVILAETGGIGMKSEECEDATVFLLFCGQDMRKRLPSGGETLSTKGDIIL